MVRAEASGEVQAGAHPRSDRLTMGPIARAGDARALLRSLNVGHGEEPVAGASANTVNPDGHFVDALKDAGVDNAKTRVNGAYPLNGSHERLALDIEPDARNEVHPGWVKGSNGWRVYLAKEHERLPHSAGSRAPEDQAEAPHLCNRQR